MQSKEEHLKILNSVEPRMGLVWSIQETPMERKDFQLLLVKMNRWMDENMMGFVPGVKEGSLD